MICISSQCTCAEAISGTKRRPASKHISFDSSVAQSQLLRMRSRKTAISQTDLNQSMRSRRILVLLVETNRMICVSSQCECAEAISGTKRRPASKHISFDSSRRAEPESVICA